MFSNWGCLWSKLVLGIYETQNNIVNVSTSHSYTINYISHSCILYITNSNILLNKTCYQSNLQVELKTWVEIDACFISTKYYIISTKYYIILQVSKSLYWWVDFTLIETQIYKDLPQSPVQ